MIKIAQRIRNNEKKFSQQYFAKKCPTTSLIVLIVKDALEYAGILIDKRTMPGNINKLYTLLLKTQIIKLEKLKEIESKFLYG